MKGCREISENNSTAFLQNSGIMHVEFFCLRSKMGAASRGSQAAAQRTAKQIVEPTLF